MNYDFALETKNGEPAFNTTGGRTPEFMASTQAVSDYLQTLPLTVEQHNQLVGLMTDNVVQAEKGAFGYGFAFGMKLAAPENKSQRRGYLS